MSGAESALHAVERIEHVVTRIGDRRERGRRQRRFPEIEEAEPPKAPNEKPPARPPVSDPDSEQHKVDLVVRGRFLPTGQDLPSTEPSPTLH